MRVGRTAVVIAAVSAVLTLAAHAAVASATPSPYPGGTWTPRPASYGQSTDTNVSVRMDDGAVLKVDVTYPTNPKTGARAPGPFPVILNQDPYTGGALELTASTTNYYAQHGYIFVHLHDRGTGGPGPSESEGQTDLAFGPRYGLDGVETAYWAADPNNVAGSNRTVGLQGCSALGVVQLSTLASLGELERTGGRLYVPGKTVDAPGHFVAATAQTSPIKAAIPECLTASEYLTQFTDNGVPTTQFAFAFLAPVAGVALFGVNTSSPSSGFVPTGWSMDMLMDGDYGYDRQFWEDRDWLRHADDIGRTGVPVLMWVGYQESGFMSAQPLYAALQNVAAGRPATAPMLPNQKTSPKYQAIVGDWGHAGGIDPAVELEWYETWMRGVNTGLQSAPGSLMLKELPSSGTARWIGPRTYPVTNSYQALHMAPGASPVAGTLSTTAPHAAGADQIVWGAGPQLTFTTSPVATDTTLLAPEAAQLWVQSSTANVELYLELQDVAPNGTVTQITHGSILGSRSQTEAYDAARTWTASNGLPIQPYLSLDADRFLTPNVPAKLDVPLQPVTWRLLAGHSLRLLVAPNPGSNCVPTANFAASPVPYGCMISAPVAQSLAGGVFQLLHGGVHDSFLSVALVPSNSKLIPTIASGNTPSSGGVPLPLQW